MTERRCRMCGQLSVAFRVCRMCGALHPEVPHPLHPTEEPDAPPRDPDPPDARTAPQRHPEGHGPVPDEWADWDDLGSGG